MTYQPNCTPLGSDGSERRRRRIDGPRGRRPLAVVPYCLRQCELSSDVSTKARSHTIGDVVSAVATRRYTPGLVTSPIVAAPFAVRRIVSVGRRSDAHSDSGTEGLKRAFPFGIDGWP